MKEFGKNILIAMLMIVAVYQTAELWFGEYSSHNFFSFVFSGGDADEGSINYTMERMLINTGDNRIVCKISDVYGSDFKETFDSTVSEIITKGEFEEKNETLSWKAVLENRCIIYQYSFVLPGSTIQAAFGADNANTDKIMYCNSIIISPTADGTNSQAIFYNSRTDTQYIFTNSRKINSSAESYNIIGRIAADENELNYISSDKNGFEIFRNNIFIPQWQENTYTYDSIIGEMTVNSTVTAEENANVFFDNPAGKWTSADESGTSTFSNENTVIKYYSSGVLEYTNYKSGTAADDSFAANYAAACAIIKSDKFVENEFYLRSYNYQNGRYDFFFDYKINDQIIRLGSELRKKTGMSSMLEVNTSNGRVSKYKRYACAYKSDGTSNYASIDFVTAADDLYSELGIEDKPVESLEMTYVNDGTKTEMHWIIGIDGSEYVRSVRNRTANSKQ